MRITVTKKTSPSERSKFKEMAEGYKGLAKENKQFAKMASEIAWEVIPECSSGKTVLLTQNEVSWEV